VLKKGGDSMINKNRWRAISILFGALIVLMIYTTNSFGFCVSRDTPLITLGDGSIVEDCCDGWPAHWPAAAIPIPVYVYDQSPDDLDWAIEGAIQSWNEIESSIFKLEIVGTTSSKNPIQGALVIGFDESMCPHPLDPGVNDCMTGATGAPAQSTADGFEIQSATVFADSNHWTTGAHPDPQWVMTHEIGHVLGIVHPGNDTRPANRRTVAARGCGPEFTEATMECCGRQTGDDGTLELDDIAAATYLYPKWKYTVEVKDSSANPVIGAAVWMHGTCFPHDGDDEIEGGMVLGDIPSCLLGDGDPSPTYYPDITYVTGNDGRTGAFKVMHDNFCFTVVAEGFADSYGCQTLPAQGNYITTVIMNRLPICDANGPYIAECKGLMTELTLDGTGSYDPELNDSLSYSWATDCPGGSFNDLTLPQPQLNVDTSTGSMSCNGTLTVEDNGGASDFCSSSITIVDTSPPTITCPGDIVIECDESTLPTNTGYAAAIDVCDSTPLITYGDTIVPGLCPSQYTINRKWKGTDDNGNYTECVQTINVIDTTPPEISVSVNPDTLWPPNHKMITITPTIIVADNCDSDPSVILESITSNEGDDIIGDGHTTGDIHLNNDGSFSLRAERSGKNTGRIYTIVYSASDSCGNSSTDSAIVLVPHNK
jgi:hypothetical protein